VKQDGTFSVNYFREFWPIVLRCLYAHCNDELDELAVRRRKAVKDNDDKVFNATVMEIKTYEKVCLENIQKIASAAVGADNEIVMKTV